MQVWKCPVCGKTFSFGIIVGGKPRCDEHPETELVPIDENGQVI